MSKVQILEYLKTRTRRQSLQQIHDATGIKIPTIDAAIESLFNSGFVRKFISIHRKNGKRYVIKTFKINEAFGGF